MQDAARNDDGENDRDRLPAASPRAQAMAVAEQRALSLSTIARGIEGEGVEEKEFNLLDYWHVIAKRKWTVLGVFAIVALTGYLLALLEVPMYRATATIQIERNSPGAVMAGVDTSVSLPWDADFTETQFQLLTSRSMAERVAATLDPQDPVFRVMSTTDPWSRLMAFLAGEAVEEDPGESVNAIDRRALAGLVRGGMSVNAVGKSSLAQIHFDSPSAELSAKVANAIAEAYIAGNMERRVGSTDYAKQFLQDQLDQTRVRLEESEKALAEFAQREQLFVGTGESLLSQEMEALNGALTAARQERIEAESNLRQIQGLGALSHPLLMQNAGVMALRETRNKLEAEYQEKLLTYKPAFPLMQQLRSQIEQLEKQLANEVAIVREGLRAAFDGAKQKEQVLAERVEEVGKTLLDVQSRRASVTVLEREVETNRQLYDALLQRFKEVGITASVDANNISMVDPAMVPGGPYAPDVPRSTMFAAMVGLFIGVALAFLFEFLDDTLKRPEELERKLGVAVLGVIPKLDGTTVDEALEDTRSAFSEAYRSVRTSLQFSSEEGVPRCLLVTSSSSGEGKSTTALTLARNLAQLGKRVLLIDADLRNPSLHRALGSENSIGLSNYLAGGIKPAAAIRPTKQLRLTFIPAGPLPPNPAELLSGPKLVSLLSLASEKFDQVIIDGPPVMGLADSPILSNLASGTVLVVESGVTRVAMAKATVKRLATARSHLLGAVLTKFDAKVAGYGYGGDYSSYHYYSYGGGDPKARLTHG